ncbi:YtxH domain-containing protein [uncultured Bacteroides sp.]|uniref:YtxH domain-containing protein n=1 Tax=uncultured Bacteroides sp. TaxID=162156 RepID=UPI0025FCBDAF|nr:YtxH domain-containing protein [uncultured Bacteroides sp.]
MGCKNGNFWIGLGVGSVLGAVAYRFSRTAKAKQLESKISDAIHRIGSSAETAAACAKEKVKDVGQKAVETGAEIADKVATEADKMAGKAKEKWEK